jgi:hypothetical protein
MQIEIGVRREMSKAFCPQRLGGVLCSAVVLISMSLMPAYGQSYEISPIVGARFGGTMELEQAGTPNFKASIADSVSFGVAGGYRFDSLDTEGHDLIEFRWMRQDSHLSGKQDPLVPAAGSFRSSITLDHFLADFTHEFLVREAPHFQPFLTGTLGAVVISAPASNVTKFAFGIGGGVKIFPTTHWGIRLKAEYLPTMMYGELQTLVCAGGCVVALNGGLMNQFEVSIGPSFRF